MSKKDEKKDEKKTPQYSLLGDLKSFYKELSDFINKLGLTRFLLITILMIFGYQILDSFNMISKSTGLPAFSPANLTEAIPTAELGKYPFHAESGMLVYFFSQGSRTETVPPSTTCWGLTLNGSASTIATFSTETTVTVVNGGCTFYSLTEVYDSLIESYPNINWVMMADNRVVSAP